MKTHRLARVAEVIREVASETILFDMQDPRIKGVTVRCHVEERNIVAAVEIRGNRQFKDGEIRDALTEHQGGSIDAFSMQNDIRTITEMYRKKGYAQASATTDPTMSASCSRDQLKFMSRRMVLEPSRLRQKDAKSCSPRSFDAARFISPTSSGRWFHNTSRRRIGSPPPASSLMR